MSVAAARVAGTREGRRRSLRLLQGSPEVQAVSAAAERAGGSTCGCRGDRRQQRRRPASTEEVAGGACNCGEGRRSSRGSSEVVGGCGEGRRRLELADVAGHCDLIQRAQ